MNVRHKSFPHLRYALVALACFCIIASTGCLRNINPFASSATVVNSEYYTATDRLPEFLKEHLPDTVQFYTAEKKFTGYHAPENFSNVAFNTLSLNFLWTGAQHTQPVDNTTYAAMPSIGQAASLNQTEMTITSEFSKETFTLLAVLDWDDSGTPDWLVSYTFKSLVQPETSNRLLLVKDVLPNQLLVASVLTAKECYGNNCQNYSGDSLAEFLEYEPQY